MALAVQVPTRGIFTLVSESAFMQHSLSLPAARYIHDRAESLTENELEALLLAAPFTSTCPPGPLLPDRYN